MHSARVVIGSGERSLEDGRLEAACLRRRRLRECGRCRIGGSVADRVRAYRAPTASSFSSSDERALGAGLLEWSPRCGEKERAADQQIQALSVALSDASEMKGLRTILRLSWTS